LKNRFTNRGGAAPLGGIPFFLLWDSKSNVTLKPKGEKRSDSSKALTGFIAVRTVLTNEERFLKNGGQLEVLADFIVPLLENDD
jgi:hypothetical protein